MVYHSKTGNTKKIAQSILKGLHKNGGFKIVVKQALKAKAEDLLDCDLLIFGTPENFGWMSGGLKYFFDNTYYELKEKEPLNIAYAIFVSCENNGNGAVFQIDQIAKGYPLKKTIEPLIIKGKIEKVEVKKAVEFGETLTAGLELGIF